MITLSPDKICQNAHLCLLRYCLNVWPCAKWNISTFYEKLFAHFLFHLNNDNNKIITRQNLVKMHICACCAAICLFLMIKLSPDKILSMAAVSTSGHARIKFFYFLCKIICLFLVAFE